MQLAETFKPEQQAAEFFLPTKHALNRAAKLVAFDKMTETVTDMALRKTLSELPRSIDRMVSDRHRHAIWQQMLFDAGKVLAGVVVGYLVCFWGAL
jgi:hypothetical protein